MNAGKELPEFGGYAATAGINLWSHGAQSACWSARFASTERGDYNAAEVRFPPEKTGIKIAPRIPHCFVDIERRSVIERPSFLAALATPISWRDAAIERIGRIAGGKILRLRTAPSTTRT